MDWIKAKYARAQVWYDETRLNFDRTSYVLGAVSAVVVIALLSSIG